MSQCFTTAELAAEWWRVESDMSAISDYNTTHEPTWSNVDDGDYVRHKQIQRTIERFAALPHAHRELPELPVYIFVCDQCTFSWRTDNHSRGETVLKNHTYLAHEMESY